MRRGVVIVDDHPGFRSLARQLLGRIGYSVVGEAATGSEALLEVRRLQPELVLLDVQLPDVDGITVAESLTAGAAAPKVLLVSTRDAADYGPRVNECGAIGFIGKAELTVDSLKAVLGG